MKKTKLETRVKKLEKRVAVIEDALTNSVTPTEGANKIKESMSG